MRMLGCFLAMAVLVAVPLLARAADDSDGFNALVGSKVTSADLADDGSVKVSRAFDKEGRLAELTFRDTSVRPALVDKLVITRGSGESAAEVWVKTTHRGAALVKREIEKYSRPDVLDERETLTSSRSGGALDRRTLERFHGVTVERMEYVGREGAWKLARQSTESALETKKEPDPNGLYASCLGRGGKSDCINYLDSLPLKSGKGGLDFSQFSSLECKNDKDETLYLPNGFRVDMRSCLPETRAYELRDATNQVSGKLMGCLRKLNPPLANQCAMAIVSHRPKLQCTRSDGDLYSAFAKAQEQVRDETKPPASEMPSCKLLTEGREKIKAKFQELEKSQMDYYGPDYNVAVGYPGKPPVYGSDQDYFKNRSKYACQGSLRAIWCQQNQVAVWEQQIKASEAEIAKLSPDEAKKYWDPGRNKGQYLQGNLDFQRAELPKAKAQLQELQHQAELKSQEIEQKKKEKDALLEANTKAWNGCDAEKRAKAEELAAEIRKTKPDAGLADYVCADESKKSVGDAPSERDKCDSKMALSLKDAGGFVDGHKPNEIFLMQSTLSRDKDGIASTVFHEMLHMCRASKGPDHDDVPPSYGDAVYGCEAMCAGDMPITKEGCIACVTDAGNAGATGQCAGYPSAVDLHRYQALKETRDALTKCVAGNYESCSKVQDKIQRCKSFKLTSSDTCAVLPDEKVYGECIAKPDDKCLAKLKTTIAEKLVALKKNGGFEDGKIDKFDSKFAENAIWDGFCSELTGLEGDVAKAKAKASLKKYDLDAGADWAAKCEPLKTQWFVDDGAAKRPPPPPVVAPPVVAGPPVAEPGEPKPQ